MGESFAIGYSNCECVSATGGLETICDDLGDQDGRRIDRHRGGIGHDRGVGDVETVERFCERRDAVLAELHVVVEPAANQVRVAVVEARDHGPAPEIEDLRLRPA